MKRIVLLSLAILALAMGASAQNLTFKTFYDAPAFSAEFADEGSAVTFTSNELDSKVGKLTQYRYGQTFSKAFGAIIVGYFDVAPSDTLDPEASIDGMFATWHNAKESKPRFATTLGKLVARGATGSGVQGEGENAVNATAYLRVAVDGKRLWSVIFYCTHDIPCTEADANAFFNSIKIK